MTLSVILVVVALCALGFLFRVVRRGGLAIRQAGELAEQLRPVDLEAFRNLVDMDEEEYLRLALPTTAFRRVQRERLRAAAEYVVCAAHNAGILLRLGTLAVHSPDPRIAEAGRQLVDSAVSLRWNALLALGRLYGGMVFPGVPLSPARLADTYQQLSTSLNQLGRLQYPGRGARISAAL